MLREACPREMFRPTAPSLAGQPAFLVSRKCFLSSTPRAAKQVTILVSRSSIFSSTSSLAGQLAHTVLGSQLSAPYTSAPKYVQCKVLLVCMSARSNCCWNSNNNFLPGENRPGRDSPTADGHITIISSGLPRALGSVYRNKVLCECSDTKES